MMNKKTSSKKILVIFSICFVMIFLIMLVLSILTTIFHGDNNVACESPKNVISIFRWLSNFDAISDPFSIFIEILTSIGGVFFGIRIGQWIDNKEDEENLSELWKKTYSFLIQLKKGIDDNTISIYELAEYKLYWESLQRANNVATRILQDDEHYVEISYLFSFLSFYNHSWNIYNNIGQWVKNATILESERIRSWICKFDDLIEYAKNKAQE